MTSMISTEDASYQKRVAVLEADIAYVDASEGNPIVFLHGTRRRPISGATSRRTDSYHRAPVLNRHADIVRRQTRTIMPRT